MKKKHSARILIVDDDPAIITAARLFLKQKFDYVLGVKDPQSLDKVMSETQFDLVLLDMNYNPGNSSGNEGLELIKHIVKSFPDTEVIPITAHGEIDLAVKALKLGARDFITKPWENEKLYAMILNLLDLRNSNNEIESLKEINKQIQGDQSEPMIASLESPLSKITDTIKKVAPTDANVLIRGENGVGKELVANNLHHLSARKEKPFIKVDLGALSENLFESELFGHVKGAFTDAKSNRIGKIAMAKGGTLFLDEIGNINATQQTKLLSVLQQRKLTPLGSNTAIDIDVRIISATNANLEERILEGTFRQDFLYRINTIEITVPPLRERREDISLLAKHFFTQYKNKYQKQTLKISKESLSALEDYHWPGNIRELKQVLERSIILGTQPIIDPADLNLKPDFDQSKDSGLNIEEMEKTLILKSLQKNNGNITHAARDLGIDRQVLYRKLSKHGL